ncbi:MAG: hypothetical protein ABRQ25_08385 [Clostridiaceae bacterium]
MNREKRRYRLFELKREKKNYKNCFFNILFNAEAEDINRIFRSMYKFPDLMNKMEKIFLPKSLEEMCINKMVFNSKINEVVIEEISFNVIKLFTNKINKFVIMKYNYENYLFRGCYIEAFQILEKIEDEICVSIWSCGQKMMLTEKLKGLEEHKKIMSEYLKVTRQNILVDTLIEFRSFFVENNSSYVSYQNRVKELLNSLKDQEFIYKYFDYKLNLEDDFDTNVFTIAMQLEGQFSIIDLYECYITNMNIGVVSNKFLSKTSEINQFIDDYRLNNNILVRDYGELQKNNLENKEYYEMLDIYSVGNYDLFIHKIDEYLKCYPNDFQAILLCIKAYINIGKSIKPVTNIYTDIYNIYSINEQSNESMVNMFNHLKEYLGTSWENKVKGFISRKITLKNTYKHNYLSSLNDFKISPNFVKNLITTSEKIKFLSVFQNVCPVTTNLYKYVNGDIESFSNKLFDNVRMTLFIAERNILQNNYSEAIEKLLDLKKKVKKNDLYNIERINRKLSLAYIKNKDYLSTITLIVESFLKNENMIRMIDYEKIFFEIKRSNDKLAQRSIDFVIFTYICYKNDYKLQRIAYSNYMDFNKFKSVTDIVKSGVKNESLIFFLTKVCTQNLLKRDIILNPKGDKADEIRLEILWLLTNLDISKRKLYYEEISSITKQKSIKDRIKQINQSRIYVDVDNIRKENEYFLNENFNRYLSVKEFNEDLLVIDTMSDEYINDLRKIVDEINEKIKVNPIYSQKIVILRGIISKITEEFLFNEKYGLNTFLSSRIRHGYCKNQLISVFQDYNLLSKKERNDSDEYNINEYWDERLPKETKESEQFKHKLSNFTLNIEKKIEEIKSIWLCIKYKEDTNAFLDYSNCVNQYLIIDRDNILDFEAFFKETIDYLWGYTEIRFKELRERIKGELLSCFLNELNSLENEVSSIKDNNLAKYVKEICTNINLCKSQINSKIIEFSNVFYKRDVHYKNFAMTDLIDTCLEISGKLNSNFGDIRLERIIKDSTIYKGEVFPYFVDIINILINNAMEHSGYCNYADLKISIIVEEEKNESIIKMAKAELNKKGIRNIGKNYISIKVNNNLSNKVNIDNTKIKIDNIFSNMKCIESLKKYTQSEGGTGLYKLYKTLQYNIYAPYLIMYKIGDRDFGMEILIGTDKIIEEGKDENIIC